MSCPQSRSFAGMCTDLGNTYTLEFPRTNDKNAKDHEEANVEQDLEKENVEQDHEDANPEQDHQEENEE
jgi:hypothetical protein